MSGKNNAQKRKLRVALAGNPNTGKTSLFNALTGGHQHVGNYPGVTVERRDGERITEKVHFTFNDLPGTYSLNAWSPEERIAQDELLQRPPDVVITVVNAAEMRRGLVLLAQIMQIGVKCVLCLNMSDEAEEKGLEIDIVQMRTLLGMPVVKTVGHRGKGIKQLEEAIICAVDCSFSDTKLVLGERMETALSEIITTLPASSDQQWIATRLLIGEKTEEKAHYDLPENAIKNANKARKKLEEITGEDIQLFVTQRYFGFANGLLKEVVTQKRSEKEVRKLSDQIDKIVVNRMLGLPIFGLIMYLIFWLTFSLGEAPMGWIEAGFELLRNWGNATLQDGPLKGLFIDGIIGGVGGVMVFLPNILLLFLGLSLLEDSGYLARAAFLVDSTFHKFGLHGKSFIPMMTGFGCTIPGIMATRILENDRDRLTTMMVLPLMSCGARFPIWMLLVPALFPPAWQAPMLWLIYVSGAVLALILAKILRLSVFKGEDAPFVMELPPYRVPTLRAVISRMIERSGLYIQKAGTVILAVSIIMWAGTNYPQHIEEIPQAQIEQLSDEELVLFQEQQASDALAFSYAGRIGRAMDPVFKPLGFDWKINTALLGSFAAKEVFVAQMGIVNAMGEVDESSDSLRESLARNYSPLVGISLILFLLIATPCMATVAVTRRESGSWKWAALQFFGLTFIAYFLSLLVFQIGSIIL